MMRFKDIGNRQVRDSGMAFALVCLMVVFWTKIDFYLLPAMLFLVVTMTCPAILKPLAFLWLNLSRFLGTGVSKVLLTVIFFGLVVPIGVILKLTGKDSMCTKKWKGGSNESVMIERNHVYTADDIKRPF